MNIKVTVGASEIARLALRLESLSQVPALAKHVIRKHASNIEEAATKRSPEVESGPKKDRPHPWRTGELRGSWSVREDDTGSAYYAVEIGNTKEYSPYVEYGTRNMSAQPMLEPSVDEEREPLQKDLKSLLGDG